MKFVKPTTSTLRTTPMMIWSTQYRIAKNVRMTATTAPAIGAATSPAYGFLSADATTAARNVPASSSVDM